MSSFVSGMNKSIFTNPVNWFDMSYQTKAWEEMDIDPLKAMRNMIPDMPAVAPLPSINSAENTEALKNAAKLEAERLRKRKGMKSTILTQDSSLMSGVQTGKAEVLG